MALLAEHRPHICTLQECQLRNGGDHVLRSFLKPLGYHLLPAGGGLCALIQHGLNVAPIALADADREFRAQRLALQLGERRILLRHRHAHSGSSARRREYSAALEAEAPGQHVIDIGDFNEHPADTYSGDGHILFPQENTYRHNPASDNFITCIDGAIVSPTLAATASATALDPLPGVQHRPVVVEIGFAPDFHYAYRWTSTEPVCMGPWSQQAKDSFNAALIDDIDAAWRIWQDASGACHSTIVQQPSQGAWSAGHRASELGGLWKTFRRQQHDGRVGAASQTLSYISSLIDDANQVRLHNWKQRMLTRGGAASWVKNRLKGNKPPVLPKFGDACFSSAELARQIGHDLANRWNSGIAYIKQRAGFPTSFARTPIQSNSLRQSAPSPPPVQQAPLDLHLFDDVPPYIPPPA